MHGNALPIASLPQPLSSSLHCSGVKDTPKDTKLISEAGDVLPQKEARCLFDVSGIGIQGVVSLLFTFYHFAFNVQADKRIGGVGAHADTFFEMSRQLVFTIVFHLYLAAFSWGNSFF